MLHVLILANMFSASSRRNFRWNPSRAARHGFYAMMTLVLSFPILSYHAADGSVGSSDRNSLPLLWFVPTLVLLSCPSFVHRPVHLFTYGVTPSWHFRYLGLRPRYLSSVHLLTALYWSSLIPYLCPMPTFLCLATLCLMCTASIGLAGIVFPDAYSVLV